MIPGPAPRRKIERKKKIIKMTIGKITVTYIALPAEEIPQSDYELIFWPKKLNLSNCNCPKSSFLI